MQRTVVYKTHIVDFFKDCPSRYNYYYIIFNINGFLKIVANVQIIFKRIDKTLGDLFN